MTREEYIGEIASRLSSAFDLLDGDEWRDYDVAAFFHEKDVMSALFRENVMEWSEDSEYCLVTVYGRGDEEKESSKGESDKGEEGERAKGQGRERREESIHCILGKLKDLSLRLARPNRHHRQTTVTRVIAGYGWGREDEKEVKRFRYSKMFALGFYGWCKAAVILVDLESGRVVSNYEGRGKRKYFACSKEKCRVLSVECRV